MRPILLLLVWMATACLNAAPAGFRLPSPMTLLSSPTNIASAVVWLDASQLSGLTNNEPVATFPDLSGVGNTLTQSTAGLRPTYVTNVLNGLAIVRFDGTDDFLSSSTNFGSNNTLSGDIAVSVFVVYQKTLLSKGHALGWGDTFVSLAACGIYNDSGNSLWAFAGGNSQSFSAFGTNTFIIREFHKSPGPINTTSTTRRNGSNDAVAASSTTPAVDGSKALMLGKWANIGYFLQGDVAEFLIYNRRLTDPEQSQVRAYLNQKWKVY